MSEVSQFLVYTKINGMMTSCRTFWGLLLQAAIFDFMKACSKKMLAYIRILKTIHFLPQVNQKVKHVEYDKFYIPEISSLVDIQEDYLMWFLHQAGMVRATFVSPVVRDLHF